MSRVLYNHVVPPRFVITWAEASAAPTVCHKKTPFILHTGEGRKAYCFRGTTFIRCGFSAATSLSWVICVGGLQLDTSFNGVSPARSTFDYVDFFLQHQGLFRGFVHTGFPPIARSLDDTEAVTRPINAFGLFNYVYYEHTIAGEDKRANKNSSILRLGEGREAVDMLDISGSRGTTFIRCYLSVATSLGTCDMYVMSCRSSTYPITGITGKVYFQRT